MMEKEMIREQIHTLLDYVLDGNGMERRTREKTGLKPTLFFWYNGHTNDVDIFLHETGWDSGEDATQMWCVSLDKISERQLEDIRAAIINAGNGDGAKETLRREIDKKSAEIEAANATLNELKGKLAELESAQE